MKAKDKKILLVANQHMRASSQKVREAIYDDDIDAVEQHLMLMANTLKEFFQIMQIVRSATTTEKEGN